MDLLTTKFDLQVISWGESFREFADTHGNNPNSSDYVRAQRVKERMLAGMAIATEDMMYILQAKIAAALESSDRSVIMDKPGSLPPEAAWISDFVVDRNISNCLIHLTLPFEVSVRRIASRFYVPSDRKEISYSSYQEAKDRCGPGEEPLQRLDDRNVDIIRQRYFGLYAANSEQVLATYANNGLTKILTIEADAPIEKIHQQIVDFLERNYLT